MSKNLIVYFAKEGGVKITHPYEGIKSEVEKKQEALLSVFPDYINVYIARSTDSYVSGNTFSPQYVKKNNTWHVHSGENITADLVIGFNIPKGVSRIFNTIRSITHDKTIFEKLFPEYAIKSIICNNYDDIKENFESIPTHLKVLKPIKGTRSKGIIIQNILPKQESMEDEYYPYILQEFFDTSLGFYGFPGMHDFRIVMLNGNIIGKFLRQPEKGKYTANSFRNGGFIDLKDWSLPKEVKKIVDTIENYCKKKFKHRYYSIDIGQGPDGNIKVFELNSAPGLTNDTISIALGKYILKNILKV